MGINLDKMKQKKAALESKGGDGKRWFWKPSDGEQVIRIVPDADGDPFREFWFHYNLGENFGFLCPKKNFGEDCKVDDFVRKLYNDGSEESKKNAKDLNAKQRFFSPVIVRGEEEQGVRVYGYSRTVYEKLLNIVLDPDYGDITDVETGFDLKITYGKKAGEMFPSTDVMPRPRTSPLTSDPALTKEIVETEVDFSSLFQRKTSDEVSNMLDEYLSDDETELTVSEDTTDVSDVESAFDELTKKAG
tara:strand:+ start:12863 stop:13600 length:738 start_codon:yes stop_codon:yes gene_type:complete